MKSILFTSLMILFCSPIFSQIYQNDASVSQQLHVPQRQITVDILESRMSLTYNNIEKRQNDEIKRMVENAKTVQHYENCLDGIRGYYECLLSNAGDEWSCSSKKEALAVCVKSERENFNDQNAAYYFLLSSRNDLQEVLEVMYKEVGGFDPKDLLDALRLAEIVIRSYAEIDIDVTNNKDKDPSDAEEKKESIKKAFDDQKVIDPAFDVSDILTAGKVTDDKDFINSYLFIRDVLKELKEYRKTFSYSRKQMKSMLSRKVNFNGDRLALSNDWKKIDGKNKSFWSASINGEESDGIVSLFSDGSIAKQSAAQFSIGILSPRLWLKRKEILRHEYKEKQLYSDYHQSFEELKELTIELLFNKIQTVGPRINRSIIACFVNSKFDEESFAFSKPVKVKYLVEQLFNQLITHDVVCGNSGLAGPRYTANQISKLGEIRNEIFADFFTQDFQNFNNSIFLLSKEKKDAWQTFRNKVKWTDNENETDNLRTNISRVSLNGGMSYQNFNLLNTTTEIKTVEDDMGVMTEITEITNQPVLKANDRYFINLQWSQTISDKRIYAITGGYQQFDNFSLLKKRNLTLSEQTENVVNNLEAENVVVYDGDYLDKIEVLFVHFDFVNYYKNIDIVSSKYDESTKKIINEKRYIALNPYIRLDFPFDIDGYEQNAFNSNIGANLYITSKDKFLAGVYGNYKNLEKVLTKTEIKLFDKGFNVGVTSSYSLSGLYDSFPRAKWKGNGVGNQMQ